MFPSDLPPISSSRQWACDQSSNGLGEQILFTLPSLGSPLTVRCVHPDAAPIQNNWNAYGCSTSASLLLSTAAQIAALGLRDLGYTYIVQDDCWSAGRNASGYLQYDSTRFPDGIAAVADQIRALSMKMGIYGDAGMWTCDLYAGSLGYETEDAELWASWGVSYLEGIRRTHYNDV